MGFLTPKPTLSELEEETEHLEAENKKASVELSITEKKVATERLKQQGLSPKHFGFDWGRIKKYLGL